MAPPTPPEEGAGLSAPAPATPERLPEKIHRYEILSELGRGAMGRVYLARDPNIDRRIALKVLAPRQLVDPEEEEELRERFLREARAAGRLQHPGIVMVLDADTDPASSMLYIAMEWVDGRPLRHILRQEGPLPVPVALGLARRVAEGLAYAHRHHVVHRDIKPANLLVSRDGEVKISDFGIARLLSATLTHEGRTLGTPFYMSPEQVRGETADHRSDLFSLGIVLYECLTGVPPFAGDSLASVTYKILDVDPRPPALFRDDVDEEVGELVARALEKDPDHRFQSAQEMVAALAAVQRRPAPRPTPQAHLESATPPEEEDREAGRTAGLGPEGETPSASPPAPPDELESTRARMYMTSWGKDGPPEAGRRRRAHDRRGRRRARLVALGFFIATLLALASLWVAGC